MKRKRRKKAWFFKKITKKIILILICFCIVSFGAKSVLTEKIPDTSDKMQVHFIDVGQGDATLITCGNEAMLIDAGDDSKGTAVWSYLKRQGINELKYLILTHTDADHIGGADVVVTKFDVDTVFMGNFPKDNHIYRALLDALEYKRLKWSTPQVGSSYTLGNASITIIAPNKEYDVPNNTSIALIIKHGNDRFLFTGDAEEESEMDILENGMDIKCDVFKAGHHGSSTSNTEKFVHTVSPKYVIISCAKDNEYGHPHAGPMNLFERMGIKIYRTDKHGTIVATSTGNKITWDYNK